LPVKGQVMVPGDAALKRAIDVTIAGAALVLTMPLWVAVGVAIRLTSPGPILYAGPRVGKDGEIFRMFKFRSMRVGADQVGPAVTGASDARVTSIGRFLRRTKLDELPQLLNVLRGEMSLVGPRPEAPQYVARYDERQRDVLHVRPGITGPTQLRFRHEEQMLPEADTERVYCTEVMPRKLEMDLEYVRTRTFWTDLRVLWATARGLARRA
jgi:lipopolysaccharide/colanic/teichoic acid biosynthesis glycosyltransferase